MGGWVYDPDLGRYLSADPFIQEPANAQSLNRYSYVLNNPLSFTDPSGFFFSSIFKAIAGAIKSVFNFIKDNIRTIAAIVIAATVGSACAPCAGFVAGLISSGGDLKAGIISALTASAFYVIGESSAFFAQFGEAAAFVKILAHGVVGGISNAAQGGDFLSGFLSAGVTQAFAPAINGIDSGTIGISIPRTIAAAVVGGTASVLGGGKFKNGAIMGAFSRLFNDELSKRKFETQKQAALQELRDAGYGDLIDKYADQLNIMLGDLTSVKDCIYNCFVPDFNGAPTIFWNPYYKAYVPGTGIVVKPDALLLHELTHFELYMSDSDLYHSMSYQALELHGIRTYERFYLMSQGMQPRVTFEHYQKARYQQLSQ